MSDPRNAHRDRQARFDPLLEALDFAVVTTDNDLMILKINAAGERFFGISGQSCVGRALESIRRGSDRLAEYCRWVQSNGHGYAVRELIWEKGDREIWTDVWVNRMLDAQRQQEGFVVVLEDRTWTRRALESEVEDSQLERLGALASGIAHEVKNPLGGIRGAAQLLQKRMGEDPDSAELSNLVIRETDRISALLDQLMTFTRPRQSYPMERMNIHKVLDEAAEIIETQSWKRPLRIKRRYDPSLPDLLGYFDGLKQCFLNLMKNGVEAMREGSDGGEVALEIITRFRPRGETPTMEGLSGPAISIEILDRGGGIEDASIRTLFTPFRTTKATGTGLGLSISQKIVHDHRGSLHLANRSGGGASANVTLPLGETGSIS